MPRLAAAWAARSAGSTHPAGATPPRAAPALPPMRARIDEDVRALRLARLAADADASAAHARFADAACAAASGERSRSARAQHFLAWLESALRAPERHYCGEGWLHIQPLSALAQLQQPFESFLRDAGLTPQVRAAARGAEFVAAQLGPLLPPLELPPTRSRAPSAAELDDALRASLGACADMIGAVRAALSASGSAARPGGVEPGGGTGDVAV
jgi:hypothetical protein